MAQFVSIVTRPPPVCQNASSLWLSNEVLLVEPGGQPDIENDCSFGPANRITTMN
jgi:hypothetical protein